MRKFRSAGLFSANIVRSGLLVLHAFKDQLLHEGGTGGGGNGWVSPGGQGDILKRILALQ
jgi:hypothetical protein